MSDLGKYSEAGNELVSEGKQDELTKLAELVESQIENIFGGDKGYSQYSAYHGKS